jgi:DNA-directed RNA polymerase specialized sigma24 family protein
MDLATEPSLLSRLGSEPGAGDWETFYERYGPVILSFPQQRGLDSHSARDVLQETMIVLVRRLPPFQYDEARGRFRNRLLTIVAHKVREARRRSRVGRETSLETGEEHQKMAPDDSSVEAAFAEGWRLSLLWNPQSTHPGLPPAVGPPAHPRSPRAGAPAPAPRLHPPPSAP